MASESKGATFVGEVVAALTVDINLLCAVDVENDQAAGEIVLTARIPYEGQRSTEAALSVIEVYERLKHCRDLGQLRVLAERFGLDAAALERLVYAGRGGDE